MGTDNSDNPYYTRLKNIGKTKSWLKSKRAEKVIAALGKNGFDAILANSKEDACAEIINKIPEGAAIGIGGSMTIRQIGIIETLEKQGNIIYDHWKPGLSGEDVLKIRKAHLTCDVFLTSTNALTLDGMLVNTDGAGNRVGAMIFGPGKIIVVAGSNKITNDMQSAIRRIREVATPQVVKDMGFDLPCSATGFCVDCDSPVRACRATVILERKPFYSDISVILINEDLGF